MINPIDDPRLDNAWARYAERFRAQVLPNLQASRVMVAVWERDGGDQQVRFATTIGMMLLMDKPLVLIAPRGVVVPAKLRAVADHIVDDADLDDPGTRERLAEVFRQLAPYLEGQSPEES